MYTYIYARLLCVSFHSEWIYRDIWTNWDKKKKKEEKKHKHLRIKQIIEF